MSDKIQYMEIEIRQGVMRAYNSLFYGLDQDLPHLIGLHSFDKRKVVKYHTQLRRLLAEGEPSFFPVDWVPDMPKTKIADPSHGGPLGYEVYSLWPRFRSRKIAGVCYFIYHEGSGFILDVLTSQRLPLLSLDSLRPLADQDLLGLDAIIQHIQAFYQAVFPTNYQRNLYLAQQNGVII